MWEYRPFHANLVSNTVLSVSRFQVGPHSKALTVCTTTSAQGFDYPTIRASLLLAIVQKYNDSVQKRGRTLEIIDMLKNFIPPGY